MSILHLFLNRLQLYLKSLVKWKSLSHVWLFATPWTRPWHSPGQNTGVGDLFLLQGNFQPRDWTQVTRIAWILYQLSHKGSPRALGWVAYPFSRGPSWLRNWTRVSCIAGGFFTNWAIRETFRGHCNCFLISASILGRTQPSPWSSQGKIIQSVPTYNGKDEKSSLAVMKANVSVG